MTIQNAPARKRKPKAPCSRPLSGTVERDSPPQCSVVRAYGSAGEPVKKGFLAKSQTWGLVVSQTRQANIAWLLFFGP